jgi:hypothetical protein
MIECSVVLVMEGMEGPDAEPPDVVLVGGLGLLVRGRARETALDRPKGSLEDDIASWELSFSAFSAFSVFLNPITFSSSRGPSELDGVGISDNDDINGRLAL